jgi:hypothetical protein
MNIRRAVAILVAGLAIGTNLGLAGAEVALDCSRYDDRAMTDKLPRPGVIVKTTYSYSDPSFETYTIGDDGKLDWIMMSSHPSRYPLVAVWQNGTNCFGSEISRNAWAVAPDGRVFTESGFSGPNAGHFGDMAGKPLNKPIVGMSPTGTGLGYWLVASDGGIFTFGDATFLGSTGDIKLNKPIVGMAVTPTGKGYWMVASDGGIFTFGDAAFLGSTGDIKLNRPISGMTATSDGKGYWMVADDGGIFTFGNAVFKGSAGGQRLAAPIAGMVPNGTGYTLIGQDGQLYPFQ